MVADITERMINMSLGNRINYFRQRKNMTQEQLAEQMNVTRQTVSNWERGINEPDFAGLCRLAEVLGVTLNDFAADDSTTPVASGQTEEEEEPAEDFGFTQMAAGMMDGAALFIGILIFFLGGLIIGGWKGWLGSFLTGGCIFLAISSIFHAIAAMKSR